MAEVFISYIHEEEKAATAVKTYLQKNLGGEQAIFLSSDTWQIFAGDDWLNRIRQELDSAKVVILMLSLKSVTRPWVNFEAGAAWLTNKVIIPTCFGGLSKDALPKPYSGIQALNLLDSPSYLLKSVAHHLDFKRAGVILAASREQDNNSSESLLEVVKQFEPSTT